jgi:hypothetical protein
MHTGFLVGKPEEKVSVRIPVFWGSSSDRFEDGSVLKVMLRKRRVGC